MRHRVKNLMKIAAYLKIKKKSPKIIFLLISWIFVKNRLGTFLDVFDLDPEFLLPASTMTEIRVAQRVNLWSNFFIWLALLRPGCPPLSVKSNFPEWLRWPLAATADVQPFWSLLFFAPDECDAGFGIRMADDTLWSIMRNSVALSQNILFLQMFH